MANRFNRRGLIGRLRSLERLNLSQKLTAIGVVSSTASLIVAATILMAIDFANARQRLVRDMTLLADVIGANSLGALASGDQAAGSEALLTATANDDVTSATLWTANGQVLATLERR